MPFNETNYRRLRSDLLELRRTAPQRFDWRTGFRYAYDAPVCVACRCSELMGDYVEDEIATAEHIQVFLSCSSREARRLYTGYGSGPATGELGIDAAIVALDDLAARYGVTADPPAPAPESPAFTLTPEIESQFLAACRLTASQPPVAQEAES